MKKQENIVRRVPRESGGEPQRARRWDVEVTDAELWRSDDESDRWEDFEESLDKGGIGDDPLDIEASLLPNSRRLVREFPIGGLERPYLRHLEQRIARHPRDLRSHVCRVLQFSQLDDAPGTHGALTDLFLVLGRHGRPLRERLLRQVAAQLTQEQRSFFAAHLDRGLDQSEADSPESRLAKGVHGTTSIVRRSSVTDESPVALARESIDRGHFDVAQALLEGALDADPGDESVCEALLDLYEQRGLRECFLKTYIAMLGRQVALNERWERLAAEYRRNPAT